MQPIADSGPNAGVRAPGGQIERQPSNLVRQV
jgi:hypothetical protein